MSPVWTGPLEEKALRVISNYDGEPVHCSFCLQVAQRIAILTVPDGDALWLCLICVQAAARALTQDQAT